MHIIALELKPTARRGGQEISLFDVCQGLTQRGHNVTLIYTQEGDLLPYYQSFCDRVIQVPYFAIYRRAHTFQFLTGLSRAFRSIPACKETLVYSNQYQDTFFGKTLALTKQAPLICHLRIPPPDSHRWQWETGIRAVKQFIAVSNQTRNSWIERGTSAEKIQVVHNGIKPDDFLPVVDLAELRRQWQVPPDYRVVSFVGRLDREKGLEILLQAFARLLQTNPSTQLIIAGQPVAQKADYQHSLELLTDKLGIAGNVRFVGHIRPASTIYQLSDVTVLPSIWSEPFARSVLESMACGTPVIASRTGGIPEALTGEFQRGLFSPGNIEELTLCLQQQLAWRSHDPDLSRRCRQHILDNFVIHKTVSGIEALMLKVLEE